MHIFVLAARSLLNRWITVSLAVLAIGVSVALLIGVEKIRTEAKSSFANTVSGTDLLVGARSGAVPLLLYSVFRIGNASNNISWDSYRHFAEHPQVAWTIPLSLGDSHQGFRVLGTSSGYFEHFRFGRGRSLSFSAGMPFDDLFDAVIGSAVAAELGYTPGQEIVVDHGIGRIGFASHRDKPFRVVGILARTGTPVDRTVHVSLEAIEAIHVDWRGGVRMPGRSVGADELRQAELRPRAITAFMVGLKSRFATFEVQREINEYRREPLLAILPGVALHELWDLMGTAEAALAGISIAVVFAGLLGMLIMLLSTLGERRREIAILRSVGARPRHVVCLFVAEAMFLTMAGAALGLALLYSGLAIAQPLIESRYGLHIAMAFLSDRELSYLGAMLIAGTAAGILPAWLAYKRSVADGMTVRT